MPAFTLTFNVVTEDKDAARDAAHMAMLEAGEDVLVVRFSVVRLAPSVHSVKIWFRALFADEATAYMKRVEHMTGQPPRDALAIWPL